MVFTERKNTDCFEYKTQDFLGEFIFKCDKRISPNILDACVLRLSNSDSNAGEIVSGDLVIKYEVNRTSQWLEDDEK